jgi:2-hydroxychromene-2-carboxylate isomerase
MTTESLTSKDETIRAQTERVLAEAGEWERIMSLDAETVLDVYLDLKSPFAYIAVRPSLEIARDYKVRVNFLPYTLSYVTIGISTSVEPDMQRRPATPQADRKARTSYAAVRQYAALQGLPFRNPYRMLDSDLAHRALLFAKQQKLEVPFLMNVYLHGWGSGWRDYELESTSQLRSTLEDIGAQTEGFEEFIAPNGPGETELERCMNKAEAAGSIGVPHYVFHDAASKRERGLFGREHLELIRYKYSEQGLARHDGVRAQFSHAWRGPSSS